MNKTLLEIYALLVCFITTVCFSVWLGLSAYNFVGVIAPEVTIDSWAYERHRSNQLFSVEPLIVEPIMLGPNPFEADTTPQPVEPLSDEEITEQRLASYQLALDSEVRANLQSMLRGLIVILICIPLFLIHWRYVDSGSIAQREP